jgi:hypothetical protein
MKEEKERQIRQRKKGYWPSRDDFKEFIRTVELSGRLKNRAEGIIPAVCRVVAVVNG